MKITIVTGFFLPVPPVRGGSTEKIWHRLALLFAAEGHAVTFVSRSWPGFAERETLDGVTYLRARGADLSSSLTVNLYHDLVWGIRVARLLPTADVVICNTVTLPIWLRSVRPKAGRVVAVVARMPKGHGRGYGRVDLALALGPAVADKLRTENPRLASRIAPFPYPIDWALHAEARFGRAGHPSLPLSHSQPRLTIGYVGRLHPEKGLRLLLGAARRLTERTGLPDWRLLVVGPSAVESGGGGDIWLNGLQKEFGPALGARLVCAPPEFDAAKLARIYGSIDIFCYPSVAEKGETFGVAVAEAMAAGCAPVVSALACFGELVRDGDTGSVFDHRAPDAETRLADALQALLADPARRQAIAARAQEHARRFDYPVCAKALLDELSRLVSGGSKANPTP